MEITRPEITLDDGPPVRIRAKLARARPTTGCSRLKDDPAPSTPATARCSCTSRAPEKTTVLRLGDEFRVDAGNGLFAELRVLFGADCIA